jgi:hypothetical protein
LRPLCAHLLCSYLSFSFLYHVSPRTINNNESTMFSHNLVEDWQQYPDSCEDGNGFVVYYSIIHACKSGDQQYIQVAGVIANSYQPLRC